MVEQKQACLFWFVCNGALFSWTSYLHRPWGVHLALRPHQEKLDSCHTAPLPMRLLTLLPARSWKSEQHHFAFIHVSCNGKVWQETSEVTISHRLSFQVVANQQSLWLYTRQPTPPHEALQTTIVTTSFISKHVISNTVHAGRPHNSWCKCFWNISLDTQRPNGKRS